MEQLNSRLLLKNADIRRFWQSQLAAAIGSRVSREGLPIIAIIAASATAWQLGMLAALATLPTLLLGNLLGHWVDRTPRRPLLLGASVVRTGLLALVPVLYLLHHLNFSLIALITVLIAATGLLQAISRHAYLPFLVSRTHLESGNHLLETAESIGETTGPGIMGILMQSLGAPFAMIFDAAANLVAAGLLTSISRQEDRPGTTQRTTGPRSPLRHARQAWRQVAQHPILSPLWYNVAVSSFFAGFFSALYEFYALKTLSLSPLWLGALITGGGLGSLVGTGLYRRIRKHWSLPRTIFLGYVASALFDSAVPLAHGLLWQSFLYLLAAQFGGDLFATVSQIGAATVEQDVTPDHWLGQVRGSFQALGGGLEVLGALVSGLLSLFMPVRGVMALASFGLVAAAPILAKGSLRHFSQDNMRWKGYHWR